MHTYAQVKAAQDAAKAHKGGRLAGWGRMMARNNYTIDPARPAPDAADMERAALLETAKGMAQVWAEESARASHGNVAAEIHRVRQWGWIV